MNQSNYRPALDYELAAEASRWDSGAIESKGWVNAPEAIPRARALTPISLRVPEQMLRILKLFAKREGVGYQVLMKQWLDERIQKERDELAEPERTFWGMEHAELRLTGS